MLAFFGGKRARQTEDCAPTAPAGPATPPDKGATLASSADDWRGAWSDCAAAMRHACHVVPTGDAPNRNAPPHAAAQLHSWAKRRLAEVDGGDGGDNSPTTAPDLRRMTNDTCIYIESFNRKKVRACPCPPWSMRPRPPAVRARSTLLSAARARQLRARLEALSAQPRKTDARTLEALWKRHGPAALLKQEQELLHLQPSDELFDAALIESRLGPLASLAERCELWKDARAAAADPGPARGADQACPFVEGALRGEVTLAPHVQPETAEGSPPPGPPQWELVLKLCLTAAEPLCVARVELAELCPTSELEKLATRHVHFSPPAPLLRPGSFLQYRLLLPALDAGEAAPSFRVVSVAATPAATAAA